MKKLEPKVLLLTGMIILTYFLWMDIAVYYHTQAKTTPYLSSSLGGVWSPFEHVTMKLLMSDHANHYVYVPSAEKFEEITHFTSVFSFVTADMVTWSHMVVSLASSRFFISESLCKRRIGVLLYEFRTWLDALDGVVARARLNERHNFVSRHGTSGYFADACADFVSGFALSFSLLVFLLRSLPKKYTFQHTITLPSSKATNKVYSHDVIDASPVLTRKSVLLRVVWLGALILCCSGLWDYFIEQYQDIIEVHTDSAKQQAKQLVVLKSSSMWLIIWFWRICNAHALLEMILVSVFIDKLWEFILWIQYIGPLAVGLLSIFSAIHLHSVRDYIGSIVHRNTDNITQAALTST